MRNAPHLSLRRIALFQRLSCQCEQHFSVQFLDSHCKGCLNLHPSPFGLCTKRSLNLSTKIPEFRVISKISTPNYSTSQKKLNKPNEKHTNTQSATSQRTHPKRNRKSLAGWMDRKKKLPIKKNTSCFEAHPRPRKTHKINSITTALGLIQPKTNQPRVTSFRLDDVDWEGTTTEKKKCGKE